MNKVSAFGFALGYLGGALALIVALLLIGYGDSLGWSGEQKLRCGLAVMGLWWGIFSLPAILFLRDRKAGREPILIVETTTTTVADPAAPFASPTTLETRKTLMVAVRSAFRDVRRTLGDMRDYRMLALFLIGFLLYNDCVQTVISQASNFAEKDLGFSTEELIQVVLMIQFVALPGSLFIGWLSDKIGQSKVLFLCLFTWAAILLSAWFVEEKIHFWIMGACVALVMGGIQSVSRAIMGTMTPPEKSAEFFGFFNLSSKATCFIGPLIFGAVYQSTGKYKLAILSLLAQLILGMLIVSRVNVEKGRRDARGGTAT
ncbi:MAG: MFS transporter [Pirellulales bacterium]